MARGRKRRNALPSIHDPPDPSPRKLPPEARSEWGEAYRDAREVYDGKDDLASRAAWREVGLRWKQTGKKTWERCKDGLCYWPEPLRIPMPKADLVGLGVLVEYVFLDQRGALQVRKGSKPHPGIDSKRPPILWWDDERKVLYAFPKQQYPACQEMPAFPDEAMQDAIETYERWHQREPECLVDLRIPDVKIHPVGAADSLSYASDKWNDPNPDPRMLNAQQYIHNHWYDVWVWQDTDRGMPNVIVIEGGELDLHERGLIH